MVYGGSGDSGTAYYDGDIGRSELQVSSASPPSFQDLRAFESAEGFGSYVPSGVDRSRDILLAAGPGYSGLGVDPGSMESLRGTDGVYRLEIVGTSESPVTYGAGGGGAPDSVVELPPVVITGHRLTDAEKAAYDAQQFQEVNDARVAAGVYDRFAEVGSAWSDGRYGDIWRHLAFDASKAAKTTAAARSYQPPSLAAQRFDRMLNSPIGATASLAVRALGGSQTWQDAALIGGSFGEDVIGGAMGMPRAVGTAQTRLASPPRGLSRETYRAYLDQKFGRTGDLNFDINTRGATDAVIRAEYDRLALEGHAVGRHGPRLTEQALDNRSMYGIDPMTGQVAPAGRTASQFTSSDALVRAEAAVRASNGFALGQSNAQANGLRRFEVNLGLEAALGAGYLGDVFGKTRLGSLSNPLGTQNTDFTDGTLTARYRLTSNGDWQLTTIFPEPK